jgi:glycosyltransferase involved in cell wall biosynthesis
MTEIPLYYGRHKACSSYPFKIHAMCMIKNEEDVIEECLLHAIKFCSYIYVVDNCSSDSSWEIVNRLASTYPQIIPHAVETRPFRDGFRARIYNDLHARVSDGDWWYRLDADEFMYTDPRPLILEAVQANADIVRSWFAQFYFTTSDLGNEDKAEAECSPVYDTVKHYITNWREYRFFRNSSSQGWNESCDWPTYLAKVHREPTICLHYPFRSVNQIEKKLGLRFGHPEFAHYRSQVVGSVIKKPEGLDYFVPGKQVRIRYLSFYRAWLLIKFRGRITIPLVRLCKKLFRRSSDAG